MIATSQGKGQMQTYLNDFLPSLEALGLWGYWVIGLLAFGEALVLTSVFAPGSVVVVLGGALVAQGLYDFGDMIWFVAIGTILGAEASFRIGARGANLFQEGRRVFSPAHLERGKRFFARYGPPSIILGHFFGPLRPVIPVVAGLSGMSSRSFFIWNLVGGFAYALILLSVGYFFGTAVDLFSAAMTRAGLFALAVLVTLALLWLIAAKLQKILPFFVSVLRSIGRAILENPDVRGLVSRHPVLFGFLSARMSRDTFTGLPVTILASTFAYFLLLYAGSTLDFVTQSQIVMVDVRIANLLSAFRDPNLVRFFTLLTAFGYWKVIFALAVAVSAILWLQSRTLYLTGLWLALVGNQITVTLLKNTFARPRPEMAVYAESSFSFPSGHSAVSVAFFGILTYILIRERIGNVFVSFLAGASLVFLVGLSRIYLVEHYLSDVLNGYLVGALWALLGIWLAEWQHNKTSESGQTSVQPWRRAAMVGVLTSTALAVWFLVEDYGQVRNVPTIPVLVQLGEPLEDAFATGRLPTYSESILGLSQEPISLVILARDDASLIGAFSTAGWHQAESPSLATLSRAAFAVWFDYEYDTAPITPSFWRGRPHDFGFQAETADKSLRNRHHARFWRSGFRMPDGQLIYVGTASLDEGLKWGLTHHINPNIDAERDFLASSLQSAGPVAAESRFQVVAPVMGQNLTGDAFFTDGKAILIAIIPDLSDVLVDPEKDAPQ